MKLAHSALIALLATTQLACAGTPPISNQLALGEVQLENSGSLEAQAAFHRGLAALHSFWYTEAREAFQEAQRIDRDFALAYWGEAMTFDFPFGANPNIDAAQEVLARLANTPDTRQQKAETNIEKRLLAAVETLYGEGERRVREENYYELMKALYEDYPDNVEVSSFYALSILGKIELGSDLRDKVEAVAILENFLDSNPRHPGVLHYMLHAYDDAILAPLGLRAAETYAAVAPASSHALHMPSHIFLQLGMWQETTASNIDAYQSSIAGAERSGRGLDAYDTHALSWLIYARTMQGAHRDALRLLNEFMEIADATGGSENSVNYTLTSARYALETEDWSTAPDAQVADNFANPSLKSNIYLVAALKAIAEDDLEKTQELIESINGVLSRDDVVNNITRRLVIESCLLMAQAALAEKRGDMEKALTKAKEAAALEEQSPLPIGPTIPLKPANEYYGQLLLNSGDAQGAKDAFSLALSRTAGRPSALFGLFKATALLGDHDTSNSTYNKLISIWEYADAEFAPKSEIEASR